MATLHTEQLIPTLPQPLIEGLFAGAAIMSLAAGRTLFNSGDAPDGCYLLIARCCEGGDEFGESQ